MIEPGQNITITGLEGSLTPTTAELPLANAHADAFASAHWVNVTNFSHGPVHNGSVIYRRTETTLSLDQSAPAVADLYTGNFITIGNETREIIGYNVLREVTVDRPFVQYAWDEILVSAAGGSVLFSLTDPQHFFVITTGDVYAVRVETPRTAVWLQVLLVCVTGMHVVSSIWHATLLRSMASDALRTAVRLWLQTAGCTPRPVNYVQVCSDRAGTLILRPTRRIPDNEPTLVSFTLVNRFSTNSACPCHAA